MRYLTVILILLILPTLEADAQLGIGAGFTTSGYKYKVDLGNVALIAKSSPYTRLGFIFRNNILATSKDVLLVQPQINATYKLLRSTRLNFYSGLGFATSVDFKAAFDRVHYIQLRIPIGAELFFFPQKRFSVTVEGAPAYFFERDDRAFGLASAIEITYYLRKKKLKKRNIRIN